MADFTPPHHTNNHNNAPIVNVPISGVLPSQSPHFENNNNNHHTPSTAVHNPLTSTANGHYAYSDPYKYHHSLSQPHASQHRIPSLASGLDHDHHLAHYNNGPNLHDPSLQLPPLLNIDSSAGYRSADHHSDVHPRSAETTPNGIAPTPTIPNAGNNGGSASLVARNANLWTPEARDEMFARRDAGEAWESICPDFPSRSRHAMQQQYSMMKKQRLMAAGLWENNRRGRKRRVPEQDDDTPNKRIDTEKTLDDDEGVEDDLEDLDDHSPDNNHVEEELTHVEKESRDSEIHQTPVHQPTSAQDEVDELSQPNKGQSKRSSLDLFIAAPAPTRVLRDRTQPGPAKPPETSPPTAIEDSNSKSSTKTRPRNSVHSLMSTSDANSSTTLITAPSATDASVTTQAQMPTGKKRGRKPNAAKTQAAVNEESQDFTVTKWPERTVPDDNLTGPLFTFDEIRNFLTLGLNRESQRQQFYLCEAQKQRECYEEALDKGNRRLWALQSEVNELRLEHGADKREHSRLFAEQETAHQAAIQALEEQHASEQRNGFDTPAQMVALEDKLAKLQQSKASNDEELYKRITDAHSRLEDSLKRETLLKAELQAERQRSKELGADIAKHSHANDAQAELQPRLDKSLARESYLKEELAAAHQKVKEVEAKAKADWEEREGIRDSLIRDLQKQNADYRDEVGRRAELLEASAFELRRLSTTLKDTEKELESVQKEKDTLQIQSGETQSDLERAAQREADSAEKIKKLEAQVAEAEVLAGQELQYYIGEVKQARQDCNDLKESLGKTKERLDTASLALGTLQDRHDKVLKEQEETKASLHKVEEDLRAQLRAKDEVETRTEKLNELISAKDAQIKLICEEQFDQKADNTRLDEKCKGLEQALAQEKSAAKQEKDLLLKDKLDADRDKHEADATISELKSKLRDAEAKAQELRKAAKRSSVENAQAASTRKAPKEATGTEQPHNDTGSQSGTKRKRPLSPSTDSTPSKKAKHGISKSGVKLDESSTEHDVFGVSLAAFPSWCDREAPFIFDHVELLKDLFLDKYRNHPNQVDGPTDAAAVAGMEAWRLKYRQKMREIEDLNKSAKDRIPKPAVNDGDDSHTHGDDASRTKTSDSNALSKGKSNGAVENSAGKPTQSLKKITTVPETRHEIRGSPSRESGVTAPAATPKAKMARMGSYSSATGTPASQVKPSPGPLRLSQSATLPSYSITALADQVKTPVLEKPSSTLQSLPRSNSQGSRRPSVASINSDKDGERSVARKDSLDKPRQMSNDASTRSMNGQQLDKERRQSDSSVTSRVVEKTGNAGLRSPLQSSKPLPSPSGPVPRQNSIAKTASSNDRVTNQNLLHERRDSTKHTLQSSVRPDNSPSRPASLAGSPKLTQSTFTGAPSARMAPMGSLTSKAGHRIAQDAEKPPVPVAGN